ncbi:hypothetical protein PHYSODRAFT_341347 [Phytophthora sojae]|uniref:Uncharacterized protein n=1 Tax=Phytophthora sojae (strain P6497) TaxID=1094619 RepID=G5ACY9_PHYSP|nr:hypothetical protein PHYSODRAFT_341347 [Phytophthora sojae]EGZ06043.1 hypothetical protein PHYSODRAFT_341347 [Phytophthora sojae]|eukprot:XP_009537940.1 hypothetical protein PHYSODRAFT_341347 [Phytophthora sojae]
MVPRPGSTTSNDGLTIQEASEAGAQSAGRSPTAREHSERPVASWSSEGTFMTGHGASDDQEGYEEQFAVPDAAPDEGAAKDRDLRRGRKPAKADDQQQPTAKAAAKRKSPKKRRKKKLHAPDSAEASLSKPQGKEAGRQYAVEEVRYVVARTELFRLLEQDPILVFLKPMLMSNFTGPFVAPDFDSPTSVAHTATILFQMLRDSRFVLGSFEMEKLCDWDLKSWLRAIRVVQEPLTILAGSVKQDATSFSAGQDAPSSSTGSAQTSTTTPSPPPRYQSSSKSPEKLCAPDSADGPPVKARGDDTGNQFTTAEMRYMLAGVELIRLLEHDPILRFIKPNAIKFTGPFRVPDFDMLMNVTRAAGTLFEMLHEYQASARASPRGRGCMTGTSSRGHVTPPGTGPISTQMITSSQAESSVHSTSRSKPRRDVDDEPADFFDVDFGMPKTTAATSTTTSPELDEVFNHLSEPPSAMPREVTPARIKVLPDLKEAILKALEEASTRSTITQASNTHVSAVHKMLTRDASKEMHQQGLGNHAVMSVAVPVVTTSRRPLGTARASTTPEQWRYDARVRPVSLDALKQLDPGQTLDVRMRSSRDAPRLWVTRSKTWVTTMFKTKIERQTYLRVTNVTDETITLDAGTNYQDWQNLAYEVTCDEDETWRDDELVWPMYGWPTYEDLEFDARRAVETSSVSKLQTRGHSTLSRVVLKTRLKRRESNNPSKVRRARRAVQRKSSERAQVAKSNRDKCDSVRCEGLNVSEPSQKQSQKQSRKCDTVRRTECDTVRQLGEGSPMRQTECDTVRQSSEGSRGRDDVRLTECGTMRRSVARSQTCDGMRLGDKAGKWRLWRHSALETVKNKPNVNFDVVDEGPDGGGTGGPPGSAPKERHRAINLDRLVNPEQDAGPNCAIYRSGGYAAAGRVVRFPVDKPECHGAPPGGLLAKVPAVTRRMSSELNKSAVLKVAGKAGDEPRCLQLHRLRTCDALHVQPRYGVRRGGNTGPDALVGCVRRDQEDSATNNSSQIRCTETMHLREVTGESDPGERGQRSAAAGCTGAMHRAKDGADSAKDQAGVIQPTTAQNESSPSATRVPDPRCTTDSRADARRGASDGDASAAGAGVFVIQPAYHSREDIRPRTLDPETASPVNLVAEDCDAKNRDEGNCNEANPVVNVPERDPPTPENMDLGRGTAYVLVVTMHSASTRATNPRGRAPGVLQELAAQNPSSLVKTPPRAAKGAEGMAPGILRGAVRWTKTRLASDLIMHSSFWHRRLAQVNALEVDQAEHVADRTRGGVATTDTAEVNLPIRYCLDCDSPGLPHELKRMSDALTRCAETLHHRVEIVRKPDATKHGQCRATDSHAEARRGAMGSAPDAARAQGGGIQPGAARNASRLSATRMSEVLNRATDSHAKVRLGAMGSGPNAARAQAAGNEPAATRNASNPIRGHVAVSKYVEGPTSVSDAASDSSRDGTESTRRGICILQNCRLAQVNVLVVDQAGDDADRTRGDVAAMNRVGVNSLMSYCWDRGRMGSAYGLELMLDAVPRDAPCVSTYADVSKLRPMRAMINGTTPSNEPADCRDEMPLEVSRDTSTVKSDGVAYSKVRNKHAETVRVVVDLALSFRFARDRDPRCTSRAIIAVGKLPHQCAEPKRRTLQIGPRAQMRRVRLRTKAQGRPNESRRETSNSLYQLSFDFRTSKQNPVKEFPSHAATCLAPDTTLALDEDASEGEKSLELHAGRASRHGCARREFDMTWRGCTDELDLNCGKWRSDFSRQHAGRYRLAAISREDVGRLSRALAESLDSGNGRSEGLDEGSVEDQPVAEDEMAEGRLIKDVKKWKETKEKSKAYVLELRLQRLRATTTAARLGVAVRGLGLELRCDLARSIDSSSRDQTGRPAPTPDLDEASDLNGASEPDEYPRLTSGGETGAAGAAARLDSAGHSVCLHRDGSFTSTDQVVGVNVPAYGRDDTGKTFWKSIAHVLRHLPTSTRFPKHPSSNRVMLVAVLDGHVVLVLQLDYVSAGTLRETWPEARRFLQVADTHRAPPEFFGVGHKECVIAPKVYSQRLVKRCADSASARLCVGALRIRSRSLTHLVPRDAGSVVRLLDDRQGLMRAVSLGKSYAALPLCSYEGLLRLIAFRHGSAESRLDRGEAAGATAS